MLHILNCLLVCADLHGKLSDLYREVVLFFPDDMLRGDTSLWKILALILAVQFSTVLKDHCLVCNVAQKIGYFHNLLCKVYVWMCMLSTQQLCVIILFSFHSNKVQKAALSAMFGKFRKYSSDTKRLLMSLPSGKL